MSEIKIDEIQVGEYVRTIQGYIAKITDIDNAFIHADDTIYCDYGEESPLMFIEEKMLDGETFRAEDYILKHSPNIINLIEERRLCKREIYSLCIRKSKKRRNYDLLWQRKTY